MYFVFDRFGAHHPCRWITNYPYVRGLKWQSGARLTVAVPSPLRISLDPLNRSSADHGPELPEYFKGTIPLFRDDLLDAMASAGVENLERFDVVLQDPDDGRAHANYKAVNIVGLIPAASVKEQRGLILRLAEATGTILVHERLRDHLRAKGFDKLEFLQLAEAAV